MLRKTLWTLALTTLSTGATSELASGQQPGSRPGAEKQQSAAERVEALVEQLGAENYRDRRAASRELEAIGDPAAAELKAAARDHADPEVRSRAQALLDKLSSRQPASQQRGLRPRLPGEGVRDPDDRLGPGLEALEKQLESMRAELEKLGEGSLRIGLSPGQRRGGSWSMGMNGVEFLDATRRGVTIVQGPNGVRVEVESEDGSDKESKVYEAPDMETFRKRYPDVAKDYLSGSGPIEFDFGRMLKRVDGFDSPFFGRGKVRIGGGGLRPRFEPAPIDSVDEPPAGATLGVLIEPLDPAVAEFLGFEAGTGLKVESIVEDSLAELLGVRAGDVLLDVVGVTIERREDVARALSGLKDGAVVKVRVNRRGREVKLQVAKPSTPVPDAEQKTIEAPPASDAPKASRPTLRRR